MPPLLPKQNFPRKQIFPRKQNFPSSSEMEFPPGSTIGVLGGGQLGRMFCLEARAAGYRTVIRTDEPSGGPAAQVADAEVLGDYLDEPANERFVAMVDVITAEFENLPVLLLEWLEARRPLRPGSRSISVCQHREREKKFLAASGIPHARFEVAASAYEAVRGFARLKSGAIMKSAAFGYDGKGQIRLDLGGDAGDAFTNLGVESVVIEELVPLVKEISIVGARTYSGEWASFPPCENVHVDGVLATTSSPADVASDTATHADELARIIAESLDHVGTIAVEFFVLEGGSLVVNEIAPRPHNSGHHTIDSCNISQFGLQLRSVTGQPLGAILQHSSAIMTNLIGEQLAEFTSLYPISPTHSFLHKYGKSEPRPGRKMGHVTELQAVSTSGRRDFTR
jgi:5-(carboxyamino)imidazole ribonucleotide synthase